ncbi:MULTISPECIES: LPS translocon maturation chaperone LptM [Idiomarina]|jgi:predicted small lipoprotein YifL|nr:MULTISPECIES: lipoprotein [Idiomarina]
MFSRIVIKTLVLTAVFMIVVGCGQKGPLEPAPMPEKNDVETIPTDKDE